MDGQNIGTLKKFLLATNRAWDAAARSAVRMGSHAIRQAADESVLGRIQLVEYCDGAENFLLAQLTALFDLAFEIAADDDVGHVMFLY